MKKILLATTMLVGTAGFAAAEVTLSGSARMGVTYDSTNADQMAFSSRARAAFTMSGETDGGLSFGATFGAHDAGGANDGTAGTVFVSGAFGTLTMGDTSSAAERAVGDLVGVGYTGIGALDGETLFGLDPDSADADEAFFAGVAFGNEMAYIAGGATEMALYSYNAGSFNGYVSIGQPRGNDNVYAVGASYATDAFTVSAGYERAGDAKHAIVGASGTFSGVTVEGIYGKGSGSLDGLKQYGLGASYSMDAITASAFYRVTDVAGFKINVYGVGASYSLGGGATLAGGISKAEDDVGNLGTRADLGLTFTF